MITTDFVLNTKEFKELFTKNLFMEKHLIYLGFISLYFMQKIQANSEQCFFYCLLIKWSFYYHFFLLFLNQ